jgi:hypothetical protein
MRDNELIKDFSPIGIMLQTFARQVNLEALKQDLLAKMSKPWHIDQNGLICDDEVIPIRTNNTAEDIFALRIKRNKKHYKPKFTL